MDMSEENNRFAATPILPSKYEKFYEKNRSKIIEKLIPATHQGLAIDIGCGCGHYTKILMNKEWKVTAIDTDRSNIEFSKKYASETYLGDAVSVLQKIPTNHYNLALMLEIIEHMSKPHARMLLKEVNRTLKPRGLLLLSTPNKFSPEGLGSYWWGEKIRGWGKYKGWDNTHVYIYNSWEVINFLKECGFIVQKITGYWYEGYFPLIGRWRMPFLVAKFRPFNMFGHLVILECKNNYIKRV